MSARNDVRSGQTYANRLRQQEFGEQDRTGEVDLVGRNRIQIRSTRKSIPATQRSEAFTRTHLQRRVDLFRVEPVKLTHDAHPSIIHQAVKPLPTDQYLIDSFDGLLD